MKDTKEKILKTALEMFADKGYYAASVRKITAAIGLRESALYNHYKSKESILEDLCSIYKPGRINTLVLTDDLLDELNHPQKFLKLFADKLMSHWFEENEKLFFMFVLKEGTVKYKNEPINISAYLNELRIIWQMIFTEMEKLNIIKGVDPVMITEEYLFYFIGLRMELLYTPISKKELNNKIDNHINYIWNSIKKEN